MIIPLHPAALATSADVVIYDSGVGGLTVARHLRELAPGASTLYVADNGWFPYGEKDDLALRARIYSILHTIVTSTRPRAVVIACNTASTAVFSQLDDIGAGAFLFTVVPPVAEAVKSAQGAPVALLATPSTTRRSLVRDLISEHAGLVRPVPAMGLVHLAEHKLAGRTVTAREAAGVLDSSLTPAERAAFGGVILGCTHFPWLAEELRPAFPAARVWSDPALDVARRVVDSLPPTARTHRPDVAHALRLTSDHNRPELQAVFARHGYWPDTSTPLDANVYRSALQAS